MTLCSYVTLQKSSSGNVNKHDIFLIVNKPDTVHQTSTTYIINLKSSDFKRRNFAWSYDTK